LDDCLEHAPQHDAELFIVEGDSAAKAVCEARSIRHQAVLAMQGKPLNPLKAPESSIKANAWYCTVQEALGLPWSEIQDVSKCRYGKILLLFDPDADGIHCGVLMLWFFYRWFRPLLDESRILHVQAPMAEILVENQTNPIWIFGEAQYQQAIRKMEASHVPHQRKRFRGLASLGSAALEHCCLNAKTRTVRRVQARDAEAARDLMASYLKNERKS
jgi:DNA gyrase subunit B/topoisomerase-4 subunit B